MSPSVVASDRRRAGSVRALQARLRDERYEQIEKSELLPDLDLAWFATFRALESQSRAVRALRAAMRAQLPSILPER